jgi:hypothetical protein
MKTKYKLSAATLLLIAITLSLSACSDGVEIKTKSFRPVCIDGVTYVAFKEMAGNQGYGFLSVKLNRESKIIECSQD